LKISITKPILVILAAGMDGHHGGLKQMESFISEGDTFIDFSLYNALQAGFGKGFLSLEKVLKRSLKLFVIKNYQEK
jgi:hypothetical protein